MTEEPKNDIGHELVMASTDAMLYGCGFVRIMNHPTGMTVHRITREEWEATADQLNWMAKQSWVDLPKP